MGCESRRSGIGNNVKGGKIGKMGKGGWGGYKVNKCGRGIGAIDCAMEVKGIGGK